MQKESVAGINFTYDPDTPVTLDHLDSRITESR